MDDISLALNKNFERIVDIVTSVDGEADKFMGAVIPPTFETSIYRFADFDDFKAFPGGKLAERYAYSKTEIQHLQHWNIKLLKWKTLNKQSVLVLPQQPR